MIEVDPAFLAFLKEEYDACADEATDKERENAIDRYNGDAYGDEEEGRSQVVARDTAETVDYMVISVLRTIISGERVVEFVHRNSEAAHEATETIMHLLMDEQDGYRLLHDWLKSGLLEKTGIAMTYPHAQSPRRKEVQIPAPMLDMVKAIEAEPVGTDPQTGVEIYNVVVMEDRGPKFCDAAIPNEEFYCSPDARTVTEAVMKGRRVRKSLSELVKMGFERDEVELIGEGDFRNGLSSSRDEDRDGDASSRRGMSRMVWWHEEYVRYDANGDGLDELLYVQRSADFKIFAVEEMEDEDDHPFEEWCPFPMQHRRIGQSLADKVMDIERVRTVLLRQSLDGIYLANSPSTYVHEDSIGQNTIEDLLTVRAGRLVRWKGAVEPRERSGGFDPGAGFQMLEFMNRERETRTGITRLNMGLDEDTLNQTAKGQAQLIARGEQVEEYVARNFANAVAKLITKKARLLRRYGQPIIVPIDGEYREVDPTKWPEDMIARARVGLGASRKDQRLAFRREVIGMQSAALQAGLPIVDDQRFYNSAKGFITDANLGDVSEYFVEPPKGPDGKPLPKPEQPDPEMAKAQAEMQMKQQDMQFRQAEAQMGMQLKQAEAQAKAELARQEAAARIDAIREKSALELELAREKAAAEMQLERERMGAEMMLERERMSIQATNERVRIDSDVEMSENREGGDLDK